LDQRNVRIVVGRGDPSGTDIRATLEDDGFQVAAEASSAAELARLVSANPPDVVVLDDTIGVAAVQAVSELAPDAKLVVIWPAAVLPVAGATRVDAAELHTALAPAVAAAAGFAAGLTSIDRPEWIDAVRKDPATLREKLAAGGDTPTRPSVTELQRPYHRPPSTGWRRRRTTAVAVAAAAATVGGPGTPAAAADADATVNRRLGMVALGGAVAAGALMIALSFGRTPPTLVSAEPFVPGVSAPSNFIPNQPDGSNGSGSPGAPDGGQSGGDNGGSSTGSGGSGGAPTIGVGGTAGTSGGSGGSITSGSGSTGGKTGQEFPQRQGIGGSATGDGSSTGDDGSGTGSSTGDGSGGDQGGQGGGHASLAPGNSGDHNPHGGPPGLLEHGGHGNGGSHGHPAHPEHPDLPVPPSGRRHP